MTQNEISSIANLLKEDEKIIYHLKDSEPDLSSWSINEAKPSSQRPKKLYFSSLPPIIPPRNSFLSLNLSSILPQPADSPLIKPKKLPQPNKVKITELKSLEYLKNPYMDQPSLHNFQPFHPAKKIRSSRKQSCEIKSSPRFSEKELNLKEKKQTKMAFGLACPLNLFEKALVDELLSSRVRSKIKNQFYQSRNEEYREMIKKLTTPRIRSKSMFSDNLTERLMGKKNTVLSPL